MRSTAAEAVSRATGPQRSTRRARELPPEVVSELAGATDSRRAAGLAERLEGARRAFDRGRYAEARRLLTSIVKEAPRAAAPHELLGLTDYRLERWRSAAAELETYKSLTGSVDQNPVLADCYRALKRYTEAEALWRELAEASPSAELVAEGRIVAAGARADQGQLDGAIALLREAVDRPAKRVRPHHLRLWYALGDLYDRAGDVPRARSLFARVAAADPDFADVAERSRTLGR